ncbi:MAG: hypothetical protein A2Y40_04435 [Candidatus Margulisbacteria bacterium GWF2_35_9]|nr:MAG: hypothetical protein A2Y40_04435 [Candidatus Margulisbacteria bacterium GWF2_35_9]
MDLIQSLLILMILVFLGAMSRRIRIFNDKDAKVLSSFVYYFSLPALFFVKISRLDISQIHPALFWGSIAPLIGIVLLLRIMVWLKIIDKHPFILFSVTVVFGSNAFFGLAFFEFFKNGLFFNNAIITSSFLGVFGIVGSILLFEHVENKRDYINILRNLIKNPLIISIIVGFACSLLKFNNSFLHNAFDLLGNAAPSIAIFSLGIFLYDHFSVKLSLDSLIYAIFRFIAIPIGVLITIYVMEIIFQMDISFNIKQFLLLQSAIPAAISLVIFANRYNYKIPEITGLVIVTSLFSFPMMGLLYVLSYLIF